jgi:surface polysaccharide O-acyltransferase-like enzyme
MKERNYSYDLMRVVACLMIIAMHAPMPGDGTNSLFLNTLSYLTEPGLCLFFVLSGALLLPTKLDTIEFIKKRLTKVIAPTLFFTFFYLGIRYIEGNEVSWLKTICSIPFSAQGHGVLWFMYTLIGLYLASPILSRWLERASKREVEFYLILWGLTLCYPVLGLGLGINTHVEGLLYYFTGYVGYFILGFYLKQYPEVLPIKVLLLPVLIAIFAPVCCKLANLEVDFYSLFWYLSIFVAILVVILYKVLQYIYDKMIIFWKLGGGILKYMQLTSNLSFGIYLIHIAVMRSFLWNLEWVQNISNYYIQWAVIVILTFALSWGICYMLYCLPFGRYIIGTNKK